MLTRYLIPTNRSRVDLENRVSVISDFCASLVINNTVDKPLASFQDYLDQMRCTGDNIVNVLNAPTLSVDLIAAELEKVCVQKNLLNS